MSRPELRWPRVRPLGMLLQLPAHRVMRVLHVTQSHWQLPERRGRRAGAVQVQRTAPDENRPFDAVGALGAVAPIAHPASLGPGLVSA